MMMPTELRDNLVISMLIGTVRVEFQALVRYWMYTKSTR